VPAPDPGDGDLVNWVIEALGLNGLPKTLLDHNRYLFLAIVAALYVVFTMGWDQPTVSDPFATCDPCAKKMVTESQLKAELSEYVSKTNQQIQDIKADLKLKQSLYAKATDDIDVKTEQIQSLLKTLDTLATAAAPAAGPYAPLVTGVAGLLTSGLFLDNRRKKGLQGPDDDTTSASGTQGGAT